MAPTDLPVFTIADLRRRNPVLVPHGACYLADRAAIIEGRADEATINRTHRRLELLRPYIT